MVMVKLCALSGARPHVAYWSSLVQEQFVCIYIYSGMYLLCIRHRLIMQGSCSRFVVVIVLLIVYVPPIKFRHSPRARWNLCVQLFPCIGMNICISIAPIPPSLIPPPPHLLPMRQLYYNSRGIPEIKSHLKELLSKIHFRTFGFEKTKSFW